MFLLPPDAVLAEDDERDPSESSLDTRAFRDALGAFATGVTVITSVTHRGELIGVTANSFNSVSLQPPLVLFSLSRTALSWRSFLSTQFFAVNVLSAEQQELSNRFARTSGDKWTGVAYEVWDTGCPILPGSAASFECECRYTHNGGDHVIFVGEVQRMACDPAREPLLYYRGGYTSLARPS